MEYTIRDLQMAEYYVLCVLQDICVEHNLHFVLAYGTALGAVRHDGFIPWDDDVDVMMPYKDYKKLKKIFKKHHNTIRNVTLTDFETDIQTPHCLPKLRLNNSYMPEPPAEGVDIMNGVWVDIFLFCNKAKNPKLQSVQSLLFQNVDLAHKKYKNRYRMAHGDYQYMDRPMCKLCDKLPDFWRIRLIKLLQKCIILLGSKSSSTLARLCNYNFKEVPKHALYHVAPHRFEDRDFPIPENYDDYLRRIYGDNYMTPIQYNPHTDLKEVRLPELSDFHP